MREPPSGGIGRRGIALAASAFEAIGFAFRAQNVADYGVDAHAELLLDGHPTGRLIGIQVKSGRSYFREETDDGFVFRFRDEHRAYWSEHSLHVVVVLCDLDRQELWWQHVSDESCISTGRTWKLIVPILQKVDIRSQDALRRLAIHDERIKAQIGGHVWDQHLITEGRSSAQMSVASELMLTKIERDFANSSLMSSSAAAVRDLNASIERLQQASLVPSSSSHPTITRHNFISNVPDMCFRGLAHPPPGALRRVSKRQLIRVCCTAASPACVGVLISLRERLGLAVEVVFNYPFGPDLFRDLGSDAEFDYLIAIDAPFYMTGGPRISRLYRKILTTNYDRNFALARNRAVNPIRAVVVPETSAHENARIPAPETQEMEFRHTSFSTLGESISALGDRDVVFGWDPWAHALVADQRLVANTRIQWKSWRSMYCHRRWIRHKREVESFVSVFINEWNYCRVRPSWLSKLLHSNQYFLTSFLGAAGRDLVRP